MKKKKALEVTTTNVVFSNSCVEEEENFKSFLAGLACQTARNWNKNQFLFFSFSFFFGAYIFMKSQAHFLWKNATSSWFLTEKNENGTFWRK